MTAVIATTENSKEQTMLQKMNSIFLIWEWWELEEIKASNKPLLINIKKISNNRTDIEK